jgi:phosphodiesterase/alkaline phosphatase D-like protein
MKRTRKLLALSVVIVISVTGLALAASSPTVITGAAGSVTDTSAVLHGRVNPNGKSTIYAFNYGLTAAYGLSSSTHSAGAGTKGVDVTRTITGLTPGTTYHYRITAVNGSGTAFGVDRAFTTTGHPPAAVQTGGAANVGKTVATPTGIINPEGETTTWVVQYGVTPTYGFNTFPGTLAGVRVPVAVSAQLTGLSPATLFHYRIVAYHGSAIVSEGADATFFTEPSKRPVPRMSAHTSPGRDKRAAYRFTTSGSLRGAGFIPAAQRCTGNVGIRYFNGRHQLAFVVAPVGSDCRFSAPASFRRLRGPAPAAVKITVDFRGNGYVAPVNRTNHVTAG